MDNSQDYGAVLIENKEYDKAIEYFTSLIISSDDNISTNIWNEKADYFYSRGFCYLHKGQYKKAIEDFTDAINIEPFYDYYVNRGNCYHCLKQYEKAIEDFSKAISIQVIRYYYAYYGRGQCYFNIGQYEKAAEDFTETIDICKKTHNEIFLDAWNRRINCYIELGEYENVKKDCKYILDNKDMFCDIDSEIVADIEHIYEQQISDKDDELKAHLKNTFKYLFEENNPQKAFVEFYNAYILNKEGLSDFIYKMNILPTKQRTMLMSIIGLFEDLESSGISSEEIIKIIIQYSERNIIDVSKLHYNPKQGRKLDL